SSLSSSPAFNLETNASISLLLAEPSKKLTVNSVTCSIFFSQKKEPHGSVKKSLYLPSPTSDSLSPTTGQTSLHSLPDYQVQTDQTQHGMTGIMESQRHHLP